jgi:ABC-2 type transport system permease protein
MSALLIAAVNVRLLLRDRTNWFFVFGLPIILIVVLGTLYGGARAPRMGIVSAGSGPFGAELVEAIRGGPLTLELREVATVEALEAGVEDGSLHIGLVIPPGYDAVLRAGGTVEVTVLGRPEGAAWALREAVASAIAEQAALVAAARLAAERTGISFDDALAVARPVQADTAEVSVTVERIGEGIFPAGTGAFQPGAQSQLVLFMFLTSMTADTQLVVTRQLGISRRMLAAPVRLSTILVGEMLGRFGVAMVQGLFIVLLSAVAFGVAWGDPVAAGVLVVLFALAGAGAAMVIGVVATNVDQAGGFGVLAGMLLGALGGAMVPLELFPELARTIAHLTPHAWAIQGLREVTLRGGTVADVVTELGALAAYALALLAIGTWGLRRTLAR